MTNEHVFKSQGVRQSHPVFRGQERSRRPRPNMNGNGNVQFFSERIVGLDLRIVRNDSRILENQFAEDLETSFRMKLPQLGNRR